MIKVVLFGVWWEDLKSPMNKYLPLTPGGKGKYGIIECIDDVKKADYYIVQQSDSKLSRKLPANKKIYFQREPFQVDSHSFKSTRGIYKSTYQTDFHYAAWWIEKTYDELKELPFLRKTKKCSAIISHKQTTQGQKKRIDFVKHAHASNISIDFYGSVNRILNNSAILNKVNLSKFDLTYPYSYSLVSENGNVANYFSEKLLDAYLGWSMPIYDGCPNIATYFPKESYHNVDLGNQEEALYQIKKIIEEPLNKTQIEAISYSRELILDKYNFWACLENIILHKIPASPWYNKLLHQHSSY